MIFFQILFFFLFFDVFKGNNEKNCDKNLEIIHLEAIERSKNQKYNEALEIFQDIVEKCPSSSQYLNDLGVTYLRMNNFNEAQEYFKKSLLIDPNYEFAIKNLQEVQEYLEQKKKYEDNNYNLEISPHKNQQKTLSKQKHNLKCLPRIKLQTLFQIKDKNKLMSILEKPFLIKANTSNLREKRIIEMRKNIFSLQNLSNNYGNTVSDYYPNNMNEESVHPHLIPLRDALHNLQSRTTEQYLHWNLPKDIYNQLILSAKVLVPPVLDDSHWFPLCFDEYTISSFFLKTHWKMTIIGKFGSGMFNHQDTLRAGSWQLQINGRKKWHLCDPSQSNRLYRAGDIDTFSPNYEDYPLFKDAICFQEILSPGDIIYYPKDYWHQTYNLDFPTISFGSSIVSRENYNEVKKELQEECNGRGIVFVRSNDVCNQLEKCYEVWDYMFNS